VNHDDGQCKSAEEGDRIGMLLDLDTGASRVYRNCR
jgi:hypothetical protein